MPQEPHSPGIPWTQQHPALAKTSAIIVNQQKRCCDRMTRQSFDRFS
jgi:hypothetical protein